MVVHAIIVKVQIISVSCICSRGKSDHVMVQSLYLDSLRKQPLHIGQFQTPRETGLKAARCEVAVFASYYLDGQHVMYIISYPNSFALTMLSLFAL